MRGEVHLGCGARNVHVTYNSYVHGSYCLSIQMHNDVDANPMFVPIVIRGKNGNGFVAEWGTPLDSGNYRLAYTTHEDYIKMDPDMETKLKELMKALEKGGFTRDADSVPQSISPIELDNVASGSGWSWIIPPDASAPANPHEAERMGNIAAEKKPTCRTHKWKRYTGLMEVYDYCEVCDEKRK